MFADTDSSALLDHSFAGNANSFKTIYNNQDQPTETHAYDADGRLLGRLVRTFDEKGRVTSVREVLDDPTSLFPAEELAKVIGGSGMPPDEALAQLTKGFSALRRKSGKSYRYDSNGHIESATIDAIFGSFTRTYTYNDYGDVVEEFTILTRDAGMPIGVPFRVSETGEIISEKPPSEWPTAPDLGASSETRYSYK